MFCSCVKCSLCVFLHLYCSLQLSMSDMEKRYRNKIITLLPLTKLEALLAETKHKQGIFPAPHTVHRTIPSSVVFFRSAVYLVHVYAMPSRFPWVWTLQYFGQKVELFRKTDTYSSISGSKQSVFYKYMEFFFQVACVLLVQARQTVAS